MWKKGVPNPYHAKSVEMRKKNGGYANPWNKGRTKNDHPSIMRLAKSREGKRNPVWRMKDPLGFLYRNGLRTREVFRGSIYNVSPKNRRQFNVNQDRSMLKRCNYACVICKVVRHEKEAPLESDHIIPAALGGETKIYNGQMLCRGCHLKKTALDKKQIIAFRKHQQDIVRSTGQSVESGRNVQTPQSTLAE